MSLPATLNNAPPRRSDHPLPGTAGYDDFVRGCRERHDAHRERWLEDRQQRRPVLSLFGRGR